MEHRLQQFTINLSGTFNIPDVKPECVRLLEVTSSPMLSQYSINENSVVVQGVIEINIE